MRNLCKWGYPSVQTIISALGAWEANPTATANAGPSAVYELGPFS